MQNDIDECENFVGQWNPSNKFSNIYDTIDQVHDDIEQFNTVNEEQKVAPTPTNNDNLAIPATPSGRRNLLSNIAKEFNVDLGVLQQKFAQMQYFAYDQQKIALVYEMTERALEQKDHLAIVLERLNVLERMHKESPNLEARMQAILKRSATEIP